VLKGEGVDFSEVVELKVPADDYKAYTLAALLKHFPRTWPPVMAFAYAVPMTCFSVFCLDVFSNVQLIVRSHE
jgi:hypothetical protein